MHPFELIHNFLDQTRDASTRAAEVEPVKQLILERSSDHTVQRQALNALRTVLLDGTEPAEVREAATQALRAVLDQAGGKDSHLYWEVRALLAQQVDPDQESLFQSDLSQLRQAMTLQPLENLSGYGRDPRVLSALHEAAQHPAPTLRAQALQGLGQLGEVSAVVPALADEASNVRTMAAKVLGYYGLRQEATVAALEGALHDADLEVRVAAWVALRKLGLRPFFPGAPNQPSAMTRARSAAEASQFTWRPFLEQWSRRDLLEAPQYGVDLPETVVASGWLGFPGATEAQLQEAEQRLGQSLPPSYRQFLEITNGWHSVPAEPLLPIEQIERFWIREPDWVEAWVDDWDDDLPEAKHRVYSEQQDTISFRRSYLLTVVQISEEEDGYVYLLNPEVVTPAGEWEAWLFGTKLAGARRWPSFWDMMQAEHVGDLIDPHEEKAED